jgi:predicted amidohydrolase
MSVSVIDNLRTIHSGLLTAAHFDASLVLFPEMTLVGYGTHLHAFFKNADWPSSIESAFHVIQRSVEQTRIMALVGTPRKTRHGVFNTMTLFQPKTPPFHAGCRRIPPKGWETWGFKPCPNKYPTLIDDIWFGVVVCDEAHNPESLAGSGVESSEILLWPSALQNTEHPDATPTDHCLAGASALASRFGKPVIQANYASMPDQPPGSIMGGSVVTDATGKLLQRAPLGVPAWTITEVP